MATGLGDLPSFVYTRPSLFQCCYVTDPKHQSGIICHCDIDSRTVAALGGGLLIGTSLAVVIPEGFHALAEVRQAQNGAGYSI